MMYDCLRRFAWCVVAFFLSIVLAGCGPIYNVNHTYEQPKSLAGKQCVTQCVINKSSCNMQCNNQHQQCINNARLAAVPAYLVYTKQLGDKAPDKKLEDFADSSSCNSSCGCDEVYEQCFMGCGGNIIEHKRCVAFCDKA